jgi:MinD-like ATPase involved in chromosome partitioning or flagellar assembly
MRLFPGQTDVQNCIRRLSAPQKEESCATVDEMLGLTARKYPREAREMKEWLARKKSFLIVNMVRQEEEIESGTRLAAIVKRYLGIVLTYVGYVVYSADVRASLRKMTPIAAADSSSAVSQCFEVIAGNLVTLTKG